MTGSSSLCQILVSRSCQSLSHSRERRSDSDWHCLQVQIVRCTVLGRRAASDSESVTRSQAGSPESASRRAFQGKCALPVSRVAQVIGSPCLVPGPSLNHCHKPVVRVLSSKRGRVAAHSLAPESTIINDDLVSGDPVTTCVASESNDIIEFFFPILEHFPPLFLPIAQMGLILPRWGLILPSTARLGAKRGYDKLEDNW